MGGVTLVTGATGFIGTHLVRRLMTEGAAVRILVRAPERLHPDLRDQVGVVRGDIRDARAVGAAIRGVDTVLHLAACARAWARHESEFSEVNVDAVRVLLDAAARESIARLVHVSTILTLPPYRPAPVGVRHHVPTPYEATKQAGERLVEAYAASGRHAVIVHPTRVFGRGPFNDANAVAKLISLYVRGRFRIRIADGDVLGNYVHVDDVARGIVLAARRGRSGAHYVLGGHENVSLAGLLRLVDELADVHHHVLALPPSVAFAVAHAAALWGRLGGRVPITPGWVRTYLEDQRVDIGPARRDLGYGPRPLRQGVAETLAWLARAGRPQRTGGRARQWIVSRQPHAPWAEERVP